MANKEYMQTPMEKHRAERILSIIGKHVYKGEPLLEVGCGVGHMTGKLAEWAGKGKMYAIDIDPVCVSSCALQYPDVKVSEMDVMNPTFAPKSFRTIVVVNVLEHLDRPVDAVYQIFRMLRRGGVAVVAVPNACSLHREAGVAKGIIEKVTDLGPTDLEVGHKTVFTQGSLRTLIKECLGVKAILGTYLKPFPNPVMEGLMREYPECVDKLMKCWSTADQTAELVAIATRE